ncbi:hypothetical protein ACFOWZ_16530 [Lentzea rhizosphaerae]|uniref:Uncharacterized protein n=1 Tax=Lentzea rhizosphaerae TaxID=2041025 RepID=A0ABV8BVN6_9PSEU
MESTTLVPPDLRILDHDGWDPHGVREGSRTPHATILIAKNATALSKLIDIDHNR